MKRKGVAIDFYYEILTVSTNLNLVTRRLLHSGSSHLSQYSSTLHEKRVEEKVKPT